MRPIWGLVLGAIAGGIAGPAAAQAQPLTPAQRALLNAVFEAKPAHHIRSTDASASTPALERPAIQPVAVSEDGGFALRPVTGSSLDQEHLLNTDRLIAGQGLAVWRTDEVTFATEDGAVDTLRVSIGGVARGPGGVVFARPDTLMAPDAEAFDVSYTRGWPSAWSVSAGRYGLDISPHAGVGLSEAGGSAEAGALVRIGRDLEGRVQHSLGLTASAPPSAKGPGSFFLFASASGRAIGMSVAPGAVGGLQRFGWAGDVSTTVVSDAQAGVGWRRGDLQASLGYVHRDVTNQTAIVTGPRPGDYHDSMVALSFSITPH
ncbi:MAG TPA: lipid A-modifier LpxR family protein [Caulobacteraceae bacterium]|nr:lipid A-modifier LpxR family protein [Caulobacteraceae bacterium]